MSHYPSYLVRPDERHSRLLLNAEVLGLEPTVTDQHGDGWLEISAKFDVCPCCNGKGTRVNPNIDGDGLSREDFDEDPDFAEDYFNGRFDVVCDECGGKRVVLVPADAPGSILLRNIMKDHNEALACERAERAMGA